MLDTTELSRVVSTSTSMDSPPLEEEYDWRHPHSLLFDNRTFSSMDEMRGSMLESCFPGDGVQSGALSLITSAVTPTMLAIPLAFVVGGLYFSLLCMLICVIITFFSVRILALASVSANSHDYESVASFFLGCKGRWTVRWVLLFYNLGGAVVNLSFIQESMTTLLRSWATFLPSWLRNETGGSLVLLLSVLAITPLTFNSRLASLRTKGFISNLCVLFIVFSVAYRYVVPAKTTRSLHPPPSVSSSWSENRYIAAVLPYTFVASIFVFSYEVQSNVMAVVKDMHDRTGHKILAAISFALLVTSVFYSLLGYFGSRTFPELSGGNILSFYDVESDPVMMICQLLCCFSAGISFVFCLFPCRQAAFMLFSENSGEKIPRRTRYKLGIVLSILATCLAIFLPDVAAVVSVLGALFSATLSMTLPALFAIKMRRAGTYLTGFPDAIISGLLLVLGISFSVWGVLMGGLFSV